MVLYIFITIYGLLTIWSIISILLYGDRPERSVGWLMVVIMFPIVGVIFYIFFGINRKRFKFLTLSFTAKRKLYDLNHSNKKNDDYEYNFTSEKHSKLGKLLENSSGFPAMDGNQIDILKSGEDFFETLFTSIKNAKSFIHMQYFIIENNELYKKLAELLKQKLAEGVEVRILYDAFGSWGLNNSKFSKKLRQMGAEIHAILPLNFSTVLTTINYRNHRKITVIDGNLAITGGFNLSNKYINPNASPFGLWDDVSLKIKGTAVDHLHRIFIKDYYFASKQKTSLIDDKYLPLQNKGNGALAQIVYGGPDSDYLAILHQYLMMIASANQSIYIRNPYFIPNRALLEALKMAALRGVDVKIMVPKQNDSKVAKYSMYSTFRDLLMADVKIYILEHIFSHSKIIIIDEEVVSVGSGNFDYRSFEHNYEANTLIYDKYIGKELSKDFIEDVNKCNLLNYESFKNRPLKEKLLEGLAKIFSPLL